jgi:AcrR family transcriptional regulator
MLYNERMIKMPPKVQITEEAILLASVEIVRERGMEAINAREIAKRLHCSTQPIFWKFQTMDDLKKALYEKVEELYNNHMFQGMEQGNPFLGAGLAYINFAKSEKNLFKFIFMSDSIQVKSIFEMIEGEDNREIIVMISKMTNLNEEYAKQLFINIWLVTHGIASMMATNSCHFTDTEIDQILSDSFMGLSKQFQQKQGGKE